MTEDFKAPNFQSYIMKAINNLENDLIKKVLRERLGREPAKEDLKKLSAEQSAGVNHKYLLKYDGELLGSVNLKLADGVLEVFFIPGDHNL